MSNKDLKDRKLQPHQRTIWKKAFEASMQHTSLEASERKAWLAVDIWERVGAFHESAPPGEPPSRVIDWEAAWNYLGETIRGCSESSDDWEDRLAANMCDYGKGELMLSEFKEEIDLIFRDWSE